MSDSKNKKTVIFTALSLSLFGIFVAYLRQLDVNLFFNKPMVALITGALLTAVNIGTIIWLLGKDGSSHEAALVATLFACAAGVSWIVLFAAIVAHEDGKTVAINAEAVLTSLGVLGGAGLGAVVMYMGYVE